MLRIKEFGRFDKSLLKMELVIELYFLTQNKLFPCGTKKSNKRHNAQKSNMYKRKLLMGNFLVS
jgi:hypothetical protein